MSPAETAPTVAMLYSYDTGELIREATFDEDRQSREAAERDGGFGVIHVDGRPCYTMEVDDDRR